MGGFSYGMNLPGLANLNIDPNTFASVLARSAPAATTGGALSARDFAPVVPGAGTAYVPSTPTPTLTGMAANFDPASGPLTDEARAAQAEADAQNRQFLKDAGINVEGLTPAEYNAGIEALGIWRNLPENSAWRNSSSAFGRFVDSIGGPAGLFGLTVGALTGGLGYAGMLGSAGAGAAAGAGTAAITGGDPLRAGLAGGAGGILGSGANALLGGPTQAAAAAAPAAPSVTPPVASSVLAPPTAGAGAGGVNIAAGTGLASPAAGSINLAATGMPAFAPGAAAVGTTTPAIQAAAAAAPAVSAAPAITTTAPAAGAAAPAVTTGGSSAINIAAGTGAASPAAGTINLGAGQAGGILGGGASAVGTAAPVTMGGLLGGVSPAAGAINLGAAGLGTAAGGAGVADNIFGSVADFFGMTPGGLAASIGQAGLGYLGTQEQADLARDLAAEARFRPYNVQGPLGAVDVQGQDISISPTAQQQQLQQGLFGAAQQQLRVAGAPALAGIVSRAPGQVEGLAQEFIRQQTTTPEAARVLAQQLGGLGQQATQFGTQGIQQAFRAPSAMQVVQGQPMGAAYQAAPGSVGMTAGLLGQAPQAGMLSARGAVSGLLGGAAPGVAGMGAGALGGALARSAEEGLVSQAAGAGLGLLAEGAAGARGLAGEIAGAGGELLRGAQAPSFNQLAAERLASLRAQARPAEERTTQAALERLFAQGRLGTTGGQRALGELARAQEEADISRSIAAQDFAQQQQNIAAQQALQQQQLGAGLLGTGLAGQQFLAQQGQGLLGMGAQVGQFGRTLGADIGQFGVGLGEQARQADIRNILAATGQDVSQLQFGATLGEQQRAQNLQSLLAAQAQDIGQRQFGATFAEQQRQANLEAQLAAVQADQLRAARLGQLGQGLFGLGAEIPATVFEAQRLADEAALSRGAQRVAAAEGLFGFGQQAQQQALQQATMAAGAQADLYGPLIQLANIASGMGGAQATAAARGAGLQYDAFGSPYTAGSTFFGGLLQPRAQQGA